MPCFVLGGKIFFLYTYVFFNLTFLTVPRNARRPKPDTVRNAAIFTVRFLFLKKWRSKRRKESNIRNITFVMFLTPLSDIFVHEKTRKRPVSWKVVFVVRKVRKVMWQNTHVILKTYFTIGIFRMIFPFFTVIFRFWG